ncbi:hypothetical protein QJS10_CPB18g01251 [Acorus calamus]|uniref:Uncharacterized protein n=1 Tax=Acorus calamus TaxID=4465 RepID=A0AAV9CQA4_ACOCL|nr:hypothetical protein QJS10_CPB18g01251 [Acorus calamus]
MDPQFHSARNELKKLQEELQEALTQLRKYEPVPEEIKSRKDAEETMEFLGGLLKRVREAKKALTNTGPVPTVTGVPNNLYDQHNDGIPQPIMPQQVHNANDQYQFANNIMHQVVRVALMENVSSLPEQNLEGHDGFPLPDWFQQSFLSQLSQGDAYNIITNMSQYGINPKSNAPYLPNNANADYAQNVIPEFQGSSSRNPVVEDISFQMNQENTIHYLHRSESLQPVQNHNQTFAPFMINTRAASGLYQHDMSQVETSVQVPNAHLSLVNTNSSAAQEDDLFVDDQNK